MLRIVILNQWNFFTGRTFRIILFFLTILADKFNVLLCFICLMIDFRVVMRAATFTVRVSMSMLVEEY